MEQCFINRSMAKVLRERLDKAIYSFEIYRTIVSNYENTSKMVDFPLIDN